MRMMAVIVIIDLLTKMTSSMQDNDAFVKIMMMV